MRLICFCLCSWKLSEKDARTLVLASLYHDVGRTQFDGIRSHGQIGADIITQYIPADHGIWWDQLKNSIRFHDSPETPFDSWYLRVLRDMDIIYDWASVISTIVFCIRRRQKR